MRIVNLRCEYRDNPVGIDIQRPRMNWQIDSSRRGARQTAYQVICWDIDLASTPQHSIPTGGDDLLWDSGMVLSEQSIHVPYDGPHLQSRQRVAWQVRVWDENHQATEWSDPAIFEMGLLSPQDWEAQWIGSTIIGGPFTTAPCPYLRKLFLVEVNVLSARLYITALGLYDAYLNGNRIGNDVFAPGWTDYAQRVQYQVYDVKHLLRMGPNTLGAILGDGWYCGKVAWQSRQLYGDRPRLYAQLELTFADGHKQILSTDGSWKTATGPLLESDLIMGEAYDARLELSDWCDSASPSEEKQNNFSAGKWFPAQIFPDPKGVKLVAQNGPTVREQERLVPIAEPTFRKGWPTDTWIIDFGQNLVGRVRLAMTGSLGSTITLRFGEVLDEDGSLYTKNLRSASQTDFYTLKGDPDGEVYESHFTFHGFRYVEMMGYPGVPSRDDLTAIVLASNNPPTLDFSCSNPLVNQLFHNIRWGWRGNSIEVPTDCPQRDERLGWLGDAQVFVNTAATLTEAAGFFTKWIQDMADSQLDSGAIPPFAPATPVMGDFDGGPAWSDAFIIVPWTIWQQYGDTRILETHYESMCRYLQYLTDNSPGYIRLLPSADELDNGPMDEQIGGYGDWLAQDGSSDTRGLTPKDLIGTAFLAYDSILMAQMADAIGRQDDMDRFNNLYTSTREAFINHFITPDGLLAGQTQTSNILALYFGLVPDHLRSKVIDSLLKDVTITRDMHISTGFVGTPYICQLLTEINHIDVAYSLLLQESFPSWLYSVVNGATTIWERWDGWTEENGFQDPGMNSFNHYAYGAIGTWMVENILGLRTDPRKPGYKHILLGPRIGGGINFAQGTYQSLYGKIESSWKLEDGSFIWDVEIPSNTTATAMLPADRGSQILEGDGTIVDSQGVTVVQYLSSQVELFLLPGKYHFEVH